MRVLIAAGGSGGHIFPAIALAAELKKSAPGSIDVMFVGSDKALDRRIFEKEGVKYSLVSANKFPYKPSFEIVPFFIKLKIDLARTLFTMLSYKPDVVVGFGGYVSCPVVIVAWLLRIPCLVHEQNVRPGRSNAILFRLASMIAVSFERTRRIKSIEKHAGKFILTGNPLRPEVLKDDKTFSIKQFGLDGAKFTILVIGGSQGAHILNETFIAAMAGMDKAVRPSFQVIHLTGVKDYEWAVKMYSAIDGLSARVYSFIDRMEEAYSSADLAITRSGASAIFELACFSCPMILVPYPFAMSHQAENAKVFEEAGAAMVIEEKTLDAVALRGQILRLAKDSAGRKKMGEAAKALSAPDASARLAKEVFRLSEK